MIARNPNLATGQALAILQGSSSVFYGWSDPTLAPAGVSPRSVCRFYAGPEHLIDSHYFTADAAECSFIGGVWTLQSATAFSIEVPPPGGSCRDGTLPVFRFFSGRRDANQRLTIDCRYDAR